MKLLIHDLEEHRLKEILNSSMDDMTIISDDGTQNNCIGCFGCWIKTPGTCVIRDQYGDVGACLSKCQEIIIVSKCYYGGFSPFVKKVLDRSISYSHPYFEIRNKEMHHRRRYGNHMDLRVYFYDENITAQEKQTAEKLIEANAINLDCSAQRVVFVQGAEQIKDFKPLLDTTKSGEGYKYENSVD